MIYCDFKVKVPQKTNTPVKYKHTKILLKYCSELHLLHYCTPLVIIMFTECTNDTATIYTPSKAKMQMTLSTSLIPD